jgi:hypothetical protein
MALVILPVAFVLGLLIRDARRATAACLLVWLAVMVGLLVAKLAGAEVSPWEALVLVVCLVPAVLLARLGVRLRPVPQGA